MHYHLNDFYADFINSEAVEYCLKDCSITEYKGKLFHKKGDREVHFKNNPNDKGKNMQMFWKYIFASKQAKVYNEYLVYDPIGVIGIIGGTIGLLTGISILSIIEIVCFCLTQAKHFCFCTKKQRLQGSKSLYYETSKDDSEEMKTTERNSQVH